MRERRSYRSPATSGEHLRNCSFKWPSMSTLPVQAGTKERLAEIKPQGVTWNQLLEWMLEARPQEEWVDALRGRASREGAILRARRLRKEGARSVSRDPREQMALAEVARRRWKMWEETGRVQELGPRRFRLNRQEEEDPDVTIRRVPEGP